MNKILSMSKLKMQNYIPVLSFLVIVGLSVASEAAKDNLNIITNATKSLVGYLTDPGRVTIGVGLIMSGGMVSLIKSSWLPLISAGLSIAIFEVLMGSIKV